MRLSLCLIFLIVLSSCSLKKLAIRSSSPLFMDSAELSTYEANWDFFRETSPANIKFLELLYLQDKENLNLLSVLIKGYAGHAFAVPETLAFGEDLAGSEAGKWKKEAIIYYTRALDYGMEYFNKKGIRTTDLLELSEEKLNEKLKKEMGENDSLAVLYTAQAWGSLINLQKDNVALVSQVPKVKALFDWVCKLRPDIDHGVCDIFYAQYEASRPKMLGGDPLRAEKLYQEAMQKYPKHLLIQLSYIQYVLLPAFDEERYQAMAQKLEQEFANWESLSRDELENKSDYKDVKHLNLFNAIAKKRFEFIEKHKKNIF